MTSVSDILLGIHAEGQLHWPSIVLNPEALRQHCEQLCVEPDQWAKLRSSAAEVYLCCACSNGDPAAVAQLQHDSEKVVRSAIARIWRDAEFIQDTLQEFWKKLLVGPEARIKAYAGRGPLHAWLRLCAARLAIDRRRLIQTLTDQRSDLGDSLADQVFGPESTLTRARFYSPFREALRKAMAEVTHKERNLLRMHVLEHCSIDQIGRAYNVHRATVARWLDAAREHILCSVRAQLELAGSHLTDDEFRSVARVLEGDLTFEPSMFLTATQAEGTAPTR